MPYFPKNHVLFIHIPKTGGTSIEHGFLKAGDQKQLYTSRPNNDVIPEQTFRETSLQHQFYSTIKTYQKECGVIFNKKLRVFSVVRNPYAKVISDLFYYRLISIHSTEDEVEKVIKKYLSLTPSQCDNHNVPQYVFLINEKGELSNEIQIFNTETLNQQLKDNRYPVSEYKLLESNCSKPYCDFFNETSINLINSVYKRDFELFQYQMGNTREEIKESISTGPIRPDDTGPTEITKTCIIIDGTGNMDEIESGELKKDNIIQRPRCKTPGCKFLVNNRKDYLDAVMSNLFFLDYCCQNCRNTEGKIHGAYCESELAS